MQLQLHFLGREYPDAAYGFNKRLHQCFLAAGQRAANDDELQRAIDKAEYIKRELLALYSLKKYRQSEEFTDFIILCMFGMLSRRRNALLNFQCDTGMAQTRNRLASFSMSSGVGEGGNGTFSTDACRREPFKRLTASKSVEASS